MHTPVSTTCFLPLRLSSIAMASERSDGFPSTRSISGIRTIVSEVIRSSSSASALWPKDLPFAIYSAISAVGRFASLFSIKEVCGSTVKSNPRPARSSRLRGDPEPSIMRVPLNFSLSSICTVLYRFSSSLLFPTTAH